MRTVTGKAIRGNFIHAPHPGEIEYLADTIIRLGENGRIAEIIDKQRVDFESWSEQPDTLSLPSNFVVIPGLVDLHVHAPQYAQLGTALDVPLEEWLHKYTFPLESKFADLQFAQPRYEALVSDLLSLGTTTAVYFATVHLAATRLLADICLAKGQRALIGKVVMDSPESCPAYYRDASAAAARADTHALIAYIRSHPRNAAHRVLPVITPRFLPACTDETLAALGELAQAEQDCHVQTHCAESDWVRDYGLQRFHGQSDAETLAQFGLLHRRTVLAHCNFISRKDMGLLAQRGAAVAHCALSNAYFAGAVFPLRTALSHGVHVGLGTDISGGPSPSMFDAQRSAVKVSRLLESGVNPELSPSERSSLPQSRVDMLTAFHLATAGGGTALDLPIGKFLPGFCFDAVAINVAAPLGGIRLFAGESTPTLPEQILERIIYGATRANVAAVWVDGEFVAGTDYGSREG